MNTGKKILWIIIFSLIGAFILIQLMSKKINPTILKYSTIEAKRFGVYIIDYSLDQDFLNQLDEDIFDITTNQKGEIQIINFKAKKVNTLLEKVTKQIQVRLIDLENGKLDNLELADTFKRLKYKKNKKGVLCELPMGILFSNALFSNNGPVVPIKFNFIGSVITNLNTKIKSYGINTVFLEVTIHIEVTEQITMPLLTKTTKSDVDIPLTIKVIQGKIPNYYQTQLQQDSSIFSLPVE